MLYRPRDPVPRSLRWLLGVPAGVPPVAGGWGRAGDQPGVPSFRRGLW